MASEQVELAMSLGFTIISEIIGYLRDAGVPEEVIEANWVATKLKHTSRPSEDLVEIPEE